MNLKSLLLQALIHMEALNNLPEPNRRLACPLGAGQQFGRDVHARAGVFSGGRSAKRSATKNAPR